MTKALCLCLLALPIMARQTIAQQPWQHLQDVTAAQVQKAWISPPPEYGPEPYYGLNGPADEATIRHDLDQMHALGYQAVTVQAGYGMRFAYLSPEYFAFFKTFVAEAKKRDMRVWIVDDAGYPSGFAGGKFTSEHPELRMQALDAAERIPAKGGDEVKRSVGPDTVAVTALDSASGKSVAIPFTGGTFDWKAPEGSWTVLIVEHKFSTSPTRSDTNPKRTKDATQSLEDYLDPAATAQYLDFTHEQYRKAVGDEFGRTILGFRGDEPDYSIRGLPWTPRFFDRFQAIKGYDIRPWLATFLQGPGIALSEQQTRAKADYYDVFSQMFRDGFFKPQGEWCARNHLEYQVHLNHEEAEMQLTRSEGSFFRAMQYVEVPGIDSIWHQIWTDTVSDFPRLASSVAHVYGHPRAFTESFAAYRPEPDLPMVRYILNEQFVRGINLVETMYYPASSTPGGHGGPAKYMQDPGYPALLSYVRRMSFLMSMGRPDASVALYVPSSSMWMGDAGSDAAFVSTERLLSEHQVDFDLIDEDPLATDLKAGPGTFTTASGNSYRTVIIPNAHVISTAELTRLKTFAQGGGKVLFLERAPLLVYSRTLLDARPAQPADFSWATIESTANLPDTPTPPAQPPLNEPDPMVVNPTVLHTLGMVLGAQDATLDTGDTRVHLLHRRLKDAEVYLFFNESDATATHTVTFSGTHHSIESWDAATGNVHPLNTNGGPGKLSVPLELAPYQAVIYVVK